MNANGEDSADTLTINVNAVDDKPVVILAIPVPTIKPPPSLKMMVLIQHLIRLPLQTPLQIYRCRGGYLNAEISIPTASIKSGDVLQFSEAAFGGDIVLEVYTTSILSFSNPVGLVLQGAKQPQEMIPLLPLTN